MGRPERPVTSRTKEGEALALWLRSQRQIADLSYTQLADKAGMKPSRLSRAASGDSVPKWDVVEAYAKACGAGEREITVARLLWRDARRALHPTPPGKPMHISLVSDSIDLWVAMVRLYNKAGCPPLRELERRAGKHGELPRSTLSLVLKAQARPSRELLKHFIKACGVTRQSAMDQWLEAWDRVNRPQKVPVDTQFFQIRADRLVNVLAPDDMEKRLDGIIERVAMLQLQGALKTARSDRVYIGVPAVG